MKKENPDDICSEVEIHPEMVRNTKKYLLSDHTAQELAATFKILGDATRIKILNLLTHTEMCVCDIADTLQMGQSAISHQLRVLRGARLVKFRREGKEARYSLDDDHVVTLMNQGLEHVNHK